MEDHTRDAVEAIYEVLEHFEWTEIRGAVLIVITECICNMPGELDQLITDLREKMNLYLQQITSPA